MRIDLPAKEAWLAICDQYRSQIPLEAPGLQVQVYRGYEHAIWEVTRGLSKIFSHRKTVAICSDSEPGFESTAVGFSEEGFTVKSLKLRDLEDTSAWFDSIQNDLLFVLVSSDDPITGRMFQTPHLDSSLRGKRIFRIAVSHAAHRFAQIQKPGDYEVRINSLRPERALVIGGERCRWAQSFAHRLPWAPESLESIQNDLRIYQPEEMSRMKEAVLEFEANLPAGFQAFFASTEQRVFDRTVFFHNDFNGSAVVESLAKSFQKTLPFPGNDSSFETTSPCRWESQRLVEWLSSCGRNEAEVRGLVVVDSDLISQGLREQLESVAASLRKLQMPI